MVLPSLWENVDDADWLHLTDEEAVRWTGRPSRYTIAVALVGGLLFVFGGVGLSILLGSAIETAGWPAWLAALPLVLAAGGLGWAGLVYLDWLRLLYVVTDEEVYVKHGLVSRDVTQIRLDRVQNTAFEQSILERFLGYGDVRIYTAGTNTEDLTLRDVPDPERVSRLLTELLSERATAREGKSISE